MMNPHEAYPCVDCPLPPCSHFSVTLTFCSGFILLLEMRWRRRRRRGGDQVVHAIHKASNKCRRECHSGCRRSGCLMSLELLIGCLGSTRLEGDWQKWTWIREASCSEWLVIQLCKGGVDVLVDLLHLLGR